MSTRCNIDMTTRAKIIALHDQGKNMSEIARELGINRKTVVLWLRRFEEEGSLKHRQRSGRPQLINTTQRQTMRRDYEENGFLPTKHYASLFDTSVDTVRRVLHSEDLQTHQFQHSGKGCELWDATSGGRDLKYKSSRPHTLRTSTTTPEHGTIELPQGIVIISRVYHFLEKEYETLKSSIGHSCDLSLLENILKRTAEATGVNERIVTAVVQGNTVLEDEILPEESVLKPVPSKRAKLDLECENDDNRSKCAEPHCTTDQTLRLIKSEPSEADEQIMCTDSTVQCAEVLAEPLIHIHRTYRGPRTIQDPLKLDALDAIYCTVPYADNRARFAPPLVKSEPLEQTLPAPD